MLSAVGWCIQRCAQSNRGEGEREAAAHRRLVQTWGYQRRSAQCIRATVRKHRTVFLVPQILHTHQLLIYTQVCNKQRLLYKCAIHGGSYVIRRCSTALNC